MRSLGWALLQSDWCSPKKGKLGHSETARPGHTEKRPRVDTGRRQPSTNQGERPRRNRTADTLNFWPPDCERVNSWSAVLCHGSTSRLTQLPSGSQRPQRSHQPGRLGVLGVVPYPWLSDASSWFQGTGARLKVVRTLSGGVTSSRQSSLSPAPFLWNGHPAPPLSTSQNSLESHVSDHFQRRVVFPRFPQHSLRKPSPTSSVNPRVPVPSSRPGAGCTGFSYQTAISRP